MHTRTSPFLSASPGIATNTDRIITTIIIIIIMMIMVLILTRRNYYSIVVQDLSLEVQVEVLRG
tara:strand:+ start:297 stop:488 length:192 start_codon:yes stop_codon:yes gene_type:complete